MIMKYIHLPHVCNSVHIKQLNSCDLITKLSTHLRPSLILAQISLTTTMCALDANTHW